MKVKTFIDKHIPYVNEHGILGGFRGSVAHGMYIPNDDPNSVDDIDLMYVVVPGIENYFGIRSWGSKGTKEHMIEEYDVVVYELRKFISLLAKGNPNVICMLWMKENMYTLSTECSDMLIDNRDIFSSKIMYHSFVGYAHGQLKKMTAFTKNGYMGEKRKALVEKYGFDCKNAAHLIRLLRMGAEFLNEGILHVERPDAKQLLEIKKGEWSLDKVKTEADRLFARIETAYDKSTLPAEPDYEKINELCIEICKMRLT